MRSYGPHDRADRTAVIAIVLGGIVGLIAFALMMPWSELGVSVHVHVDTGLIERILR